MQLTDALYVHMCNEDKFSLKKKQIVILLLILVSSCLHEQPSHAKEMIP